MSMIVSVSASWLRGLQLLPAQALLPSLDVMSSSIDVVKVTMLDIRIVRELACLHADNYRFFAMCSNMMQEDLEDLTDVLDEMFAADERFVGKYELRGPALRCCGGQGCVEFAKCTRSGKHVAIKVSALTPG